jgi:DNA-binding IclR family transcriptional regulator
VLLQVKYGSYPLRHVREIGSRLPALRTAMAQALLARLPEMAPEAHLAADAAASWRPRLLAIRRRGFVLGASVLTAGVTTVATDR